MDPESYDRAWDAAYVARCKADAYDAKIAREKASVEGRTRFAKNREKPSAIAVEADEAQEEAEYAAAQEKTYHKYWYPKCLKSETPHPYCVPLSASRYSLAVAVPLV